MIPVGGWLCLVVLLISSTDVASDIIYLVLDFTRAVVRGCRMLRGGMSL